MSADTECGSIPTKLGHDQFGNGLGTARAQDFVDEKRRPGEDLSVRDTSHSAQKDASASMRRLHVLCMIVYCTEIVTSFSGLSVRKSADREIKSFPRPTTVAAALRLGGVFASGTSRRPVKVPVTWSVDRCVMER